MTEGLINQVKEALAELKAKESKQSYQEMLKQTAAIVKQKDISDYKQGDIFDE